MSSILALSLSLSAPGSLGALGVTETVPALAEFEGAHASGSSYGMVVVALGFVLAGAWLIFLSSRARG